MNVQRWDCPIDDCKTWYESDTSDISSVLMQKMVEGHMRDEHHLKECPTCEGTGDCGFIDDAHMTMGGPEHFTRDVHFVRIKREVNGKSYMMSVCACCSGSTYVEIDSNHSQSDDCGSEPPGEDPPEPEYPDDSLEGHCSCHDAAVCPDG